MHYRSIRISFDGLKFANNSYVPQYVHASSSLLHVWSWERKNLHIWAYLHRWPAASIYTETGEMDYKL